MFRVALVLLPALFIYDRGVAALAAHRDFLSRGGLAHQEFQPAEGLALRSRAWARSGLDDRRQLLDDCDVLALGSACESLRISAEKGTANATGSHPEGAGDSGHGFTQSVWGEEGAFVRLATTAEGYDTANGIADRSPGDGFTQSAWGDDSAPVRQPKKFTPPPLPNTSTVNAVVKDDTACAAPGKVIFVHVMKTAGLAVDKFLNCQGEEDGWSIYHKDGANPHYEGRTSCPPSVCTLHGSSFKSAGPNECGAAFHGAAQFTILRDPVERVWSFYNYLRMLKYEPYLKNSLEFVLQNYGLVDLDEFADDPKARCGFCNLQLSNAMVLYNFVGRREAWELKESIAKEALSKRDLRPALEKAKSILAGMQTVYFIEDIPSFGNSFNSDDRLSPVSPSRVTGGKCHMTHTNRQKYSATADAATMKLIRKLNWADIELYNFARTLPNRASLQAHNHKWPRQ